MKPSEIAKAYNQITHIWESDSFNRQNGIEQHKRAIAFANNMGYALDVGCGSTGRFIDLLIENNFTPQGVDISEEMIKLARKKHPTVEFFLQDICDWEMPRQYDFISAWDSIWHIPLDQQENVLTKLISSLNQDGVLIFSCGGTEEAGEHKHDFRGPEVYYSSLGINGFLTLFTQLNCVCRHFEYDQYPELHAYFIVQKS